MSNDKSEKSAGDSSQRAFEEVEHTADYAITIYGKTLQELLINAAGGMNSLMRPKYRASDREEKKSVKLEALDAEGLLVEWLSELAYWAEVEMLIFSNFNLHSVSPTHVEATIKGRRAAELEKHIKAVTYHNLEIKYTNEGLTATVVFDV